MAGFRAVSKLKRFGNKLVIEDKQEKKVVDNAEVSRLGRLGDSVN